MATAYLAGLMRGRTTACEPKSKDRYGRTVGICKADGEDVGEAMVRQGMAGAATRLGKQQGPPAPGLEGPLTGSYKIPIFLSKGGIDARTRVRDQS